MDKPIQLLDLLSGCSAHTLLDNDVLPVCRIVRHKRLEHITNCANFVSYICFRELVESVRHVADEIGVIVEQGSDPILYRSLRKSVN